MTHQQSPSLIHPPPPSAGGALGFVIERGAGQMEGRVAPSVHGDAALLALLGLIVRPITSFTRVQVLFTLWPNVNNK